MSSRIGWFLAACLTLLSLPGTCATQAEDIYLEPARESDSSYNAIWAQAAAYPRGERGIYRQAPHRNVRPERESEPQPNLGGAANQFLRSRIRPVSLENLEAKIDHTLATYHRRLLDVSKNDPWEVMHGIIAYGCDTKLARGRATDPVNAISYVCWNGVCAGDRLLYTKGDRLEARKGPHVQGHYGQFLAILAQSRVPTDYPLLVDNKPFTIADLIESEKLGCRANTELTFKLIALTHYLGSDATWKNDLGEDWSIERLIEAEIGSTIQGAACGGTHRLTGIYYPVDRRLKEGKPITGEYERAQKYTHDYQRYAFSLQNPDGSFSTEWFKRPGNRQDVDRKVKTTGHILEWLTFTLSDEELKDPKTVKTVNFIASALLSEPKRQWEIGPLGHAIHALQIYRDRVYRSPTTEPTEERTPIAKAAEAEVAPKVARNTAEDVTAADTIEAADEEAAEATTELPAEEAEPVEETTTDEETLEEPEEATPAPAIEGPVLFPTNI